MLELVFIPFVVSLLSVTFLRPSWPSLLAYVAGLVIAFGVVLNSGKHDPASQSLAVGAWLWGTVVAGLVRSLWAGPAQVALLTVYPSTRFNRWMRSLWWLLSAFWLAFGAGSIGSAFASNAAIMYAKSFEASQILYDRSMAEAARGFFELSFAALGAIIALFSQPVLTNKGLREGIAVARWDEFESYAWQEDKLILHWKKKFFRRSSSYVVNPAEQETAQRLLGLHLPDQQMQPASPGQATV